MNQLMDNIEHNYKNKNKKGIWFLNCCVYLEDTCSASVQNQRWFLDMKDRVIAIPLKLKCPQMEVPPTEKGTIDDWIGKA